MIIKILSSASQDFHGVKYNDAKMQKGDGELMEMKNFPSFINRDSTQQEVRDYFKSISKGVSGKIKKPQFHAVISSKFRNHTKEELTKVANEVMKELGYENQPYIIVFHNDTDNNHVHIVSTRVSKDTGKKINDSFEKIKAQQALSNVMERNYGINSEKKLEALLKYKIQSIKQFETLLNRQGYKISINKNNPQQIDIIKNGIVLKSIDLDSLKIESSLSASDKKRAKQLYAILEKYNKIYSNKVFRVIDDREEKGKKKRHESINAENKPNSKIEFESELQHHLKMKFGVDIIFHNKDDKNPFGYTIIDNKSGIVYKGSEIMKLKDLFEFTDSEIDKQTFEKLKEFNVNDAERKEVLLKYLKLSNQNIKDFMLFRNNKRLKIEDWKKLKEDTLEFVKGGKKGDLNVVEGDNGVFYVIHKKLHHVESLEKLIGEKLNAEYVNKDSVKENVEQNLSNDKKLSNGRSENILGTLMKDLMKSEFSKSDPDEIGKRNKRKRKKR